MSEITEFHPFSREMPQRTIQLLALQDGCWDQFILTVDKSRKSISKTELDQQPGKT